MIKLMKTDYDKVRILLKNNEIIMAFAYAVLEEKQEGVVYVDNALEPRSCLITNKGGKYLVAGDENNMSFIESLSEFLKDNNNHSVYFDLYVSKVEWITIIQAILEGYVVKLGRTIYQHKNQSLGNTECLKQQLPINYTFCRMDASLYHQYVTEYDSSYVAIWGDGEQFLKHGFGFCILLEGKIISTCNTFFVGNGYAEIDIMTKSEFRGKGFATLCAIAYMEYSLKMNLIPIWDADAGNEPSNKLAVKLGFNKFLDTNIIWWHQDKEVIQSYLKKYNYIENSLVE